MSDITVLTFILNCFIMIPLMFFVYIASIFLHEMGHLAILRKHAKKARINFDKIGGKWRLCAGKEEDYLNLSKKELELVYITGIILGLFPIAFFSIVNLWGLFLFPIYIGGCKSDLEKLKKLE